MADEDLEEILAARRYLYAAFQTVFGSEPRNLNEVLDKSLIQQAALRVQVDFSENLYEQIDRLAKEKPALQSDYTRLFVGPAKLPAPLWESVYLSQSEALFQPETLQVRNEYRAHGFLPEAYPRVADDHLALELDYLGALAQRMLVAHESQEGAAVCEDAQASLDFLRGHLLRWLDAFISKMKSDGQSEFYATMAESLGCFVAADVMIVERMVNKDDL